MDIPKQCIFSGSTEDLNTCMTVTLDNGDAVQAWISDEFAESATPSKVKQAVIEFGHKLDDKQLEIDALIAKAKELGLELAIPGVKPPTPAPAPVQAPAPQTAEAIAEGFVPDNPDNRIIDGRTADSKHLDARVSGSASGLGSTVSGAGSEYSITSQDKPSIDLKEGEMAEIGVVKGRLGTPVVIPVKRRGKTGETRVTVIETGGDNELQKRFKNMSNEEPHDFVNAGYQVKTVRCGLCKGTGRVMGGKKECPKCGGVGMYDA
jgi:hypothetical protein